MSPKVVENIGELVTMAPLAKENRRIGIKDADLGRVGPKAWLAIDGHGKVLASGTGPVPSTYGSFGRFDAQGGLIMPGLIDSHTHPIFAGSRAKEFALRANGATYQEIAAAGGGIRSSMGATRAAPDNELLALLEERLDRQLSLGITTVEAKSGYGLSVETELRLLRLLAKAKARRQDRQHVAVTCLALHAASPEHMDLSSYVDACTRELLPEVATGGLAEWVDAFIETGYFTVKDVEPYAKRATDLGLKLRLHADEFSDAGAAAAAAAWGAVSADHLQCASDAGIARMAEKGVTATLLPGTSLYTKIPFANARRFADAGVPVALATDFNPGSCRIDDLALLATVSSVQSGFRPAEAVAAVTYVAAGGLSLQDRKGALSPGYDADLVLYPLTSVEDWLADFGRTRPSAVWCRGAQVV